LGSSKSNDIYKIGSKYTCSYDNTEFTNGLLLGLVHSYKTTDLLDVGVEGADSSGLVGYWKFNEGSGTTAADSSGYGNTGTLYNGPTWVDGKFGKALSFDGIDDYVEVPYNTNLYPGAGSWTAEAWIKTSAYKDMAVVGSPESTGDNAEWILAVWINPYPGGNLVANIYFANTSGFNSGKYVDVYGTTPLNDSSWHHIAGVRDTTLKKVFIYVDGKLENSVDEPTTWNVTYTNNIRIGRAVVEYDGTNPEAWFQGLIDEVRIYNRALTEEEIKAEYFAALKLKQKTSSSLLLAYTKGTCNAIENKMYLVEQQTIPSNPFSSFSLAIPKEYPFEIRAQYDKIQLNGSDRFGLGSHKVCIEKSGVSSANKPIVDVEKC
jgi:hypothetical protein